MKKNSDRNIQFTCDERDNAIDRMLKKSGGKPFSVADTATELGIRQPDDETCQSLLRALENDERLIGDEQDGFADRAAFFTALEFPVVPTAVEITDGILIPGHRFCPFVSGDVFPSEIKLTESGKNVPAKTETYSVSNETLSPLIMLYGDEIRSILEAENSDNLKVKDTPLKITVFRLADFYKRHDFKQGDILLCKVTDYNKGFIKFRYMSGESRDRERISDNAELLEQAVIETVRRGYDDIKVPEQLAKTFFFARAVLPGGADSASLDELVIFSERLQISYRNGFAALKEKTSCGDEHGYNDDDECECSDDIQEILPAGLSLSSGEVKEFSALLRDIGSPLSPVEIDSMILDNCYSRDMNFDDFKARAFGNSKLDFADEAQEVVFLNFIEERFEDLTENYNRAEDEDKAPRRATLILLADDRLKFFDICTKMAEKERPDGQFFQSLAKETLLQDKLLAHLNDPRFTPATEELEQLDDMIDSMAERQEKLLERFGIYDD